VSQPIAVLGATEGLARSVAWSLVDRGARVRAVLDRPAKAGVFSGTGVDLALAAMDGGPSLPRALRGAAWVVWEGPRTEAPGPVEERVLAAALEARARPLRLSLLGADPASPDPCLAASGRLDQRVLAAEGCVVRCAPTVQDLDRFLVGPALKTGRLPLPAEPAVAWADAIDLAEAVARLLLSDAGARAVDLTGPEAVEAADLAAWLTALARREVVLSPPEASPLPIPDAASRVTEDLPRLLGRPAHTIAGWLRERFHGGG
jgi:uncharacterized protein YbjT (DUF2867 family)